MSRQVSRVPDTDGVAVTFATVKHSTREPNRRRDRAYRWFDLRVHLDIMCEVQQWANYCLIKDYVISAEIIAK